MFPDENRYKYEYKNYDKAKIEPITPLNEQIERSVEAFYKLTQTIINELIPTVERLCNILWPMIKEISNQYPNKRVIYLATHGKHRVRKKNINRIAKWFEREARK